jgi:hypothetical protein
VRGNHDDAALSNYYAWKRAPADALPAKYDYVRAFSEADVAFLEQLPFTITLPNQSAIIVHAGLVPGVPLDEQEPINMYKMRWLTQPVDAAGSPVGPWNASETLPSGGDGMAHMEAKAWAAQWPGPLHVIFGHDAKRGLQVRDSGGAKKKVPSWRTKLLVLISESENPLRQAWTRAAAMDASSQRAFCRSVVFFSFLFFLFSVGLTGPTWRFGPSPF